MLHHQALDEAPGRLEDLDALVKRTFGPGAAVRQVDQLSERAAVVARLHLNGAPVPSVIAKFTRAGRPAGAPADAAPPDSAPPDSTPPDFAEEQLAYRFLATLARTEKVTPDLLAAEAGGIILLEDLGPQSRGADRDSGYLIPRLAEAIAELHGPTVGHFAEYCDMRLEAGLGGPDDDRRRYGKVAGRDLYAMGRGFFLTRYEIATVRHDSAALEAELSAVDVAISNPGPFLAFIHDDLGNARQTFEVGDRLYLLDLEYAKYSHALLDFVKPVIGKFETNLTNRSYGWTGANFPLALIDHYRRYTETRFGVRHEDGVWREAVGAAMTYGAVALVGRLCRLEPDRNLRGTVRHNIKAILGVLANRLRELDTQPWVRTFIDGYLTNR